MMHVAGEDGEFIDRRTIEFVVEEELKRCDPQQQLRAKAYGRILAEVSDAMVARLTADKCQLLDDEDRAFISGECLPLVRASIAKSRKLRFDRFDRVVCMIGGLRGWAVGTIQALQAY